MSFGNRKRKRQQYLLDVKVQSRGLSGRRLKWLAAVLSAVAVLVLTGYGGYRLVRFGLARFLFANPRFAIIQIEVENDGVMTPPVVTRIAGVEVGQNLFSVDLGEVRRALEMVPLVKRVEVRRVLPQRLFIHIDERIAVALLRGPGRGAGESTFLIDRSGVVMKPLPLPDGTVLRPQSAGTLPVITGVAPTDLRIGQAVESPQIYRALELLDRLAQVQAGAMLEIDQIDLSNVHQLRLITRQRTIVKFDMDDFPQQLRRLSTILVWAQQRQKLVQSVDLTVSRGVPVTFVN